MLSVDHYELIRRKHFVDGLSVRAISRQCGLDLLQFHGDESPQYLSSFDVGKVIRAVRVRGKDSLSAVKEYRPAFFLFDTLRPDAFGGTGEVFDWAVLESLGDLKTPFFVSGGLTPENVGILIERLRPFGVDVSSGVEKAPGKKDHQKVKEFINKVKQVEGRGINP